MGECRGVECAYTVRSHESVPEPYAGRACRRGRCEAVRRSVVRLFAACGNITCAWTKLSGRVYVKWSKVQTHSPDHPDPGRFQAVRFGLTPCSANVRLRRPP